MRKFGIFLSRKIANRLPDKEINFFIFFPNSKIVQARLVLSGRSLSIFERCFLAVILHDYYVIRPRYKCSQYLNTAPLYARPKPCSRAKFRAKNTGSFRPQRRNLFKQPATCRGEVAWRSRKRPKYFVPL